MQHTKENLVALGGAHEVQKTKLGGLQSSENSLSALRTQYLAEVFALSPDTAATLAELAFGGAA